jgi:hypothetical protein
MIKQAEQTLYALLEEGKIQETEVGSGKFDRQAELEDLYQNVTSSL